MKKHQIKKTTASAIIILIFYFLIKKLLENKEELRNFIRMTNPEYLTISIIFLVLSYLILSFNWKIILNKMGNKIDYLPALKIRTISDLGRYVPGKVWYILGRTYFGEKLKISKTNTIISTIIELGFLVLSGTLLFAISYIFQINGPERYILLIISVLIISSFPILVNKLINLGLRLKKRKEKLKISNKNSLILFSLYLLHWIIIGLFVLFITKSVYPTIGIEKFILISGAFALSWLIGFFSIIVPGGLGVREGALALLFGEFLPISLAILIPIAIRIISLVIEALLAAIVTKIKIKN